MKFVKSIESSKENALDSIDSITLIDFIDLQKSQSDEILKWRNDKSVREFCLNQEVITEAAHAAFLQSLCGDLSRKYFLVCSAKYGAIGVINLVKITKNSAECGVYKNPFCNLRKVGEILMREILRYGFLNLELQSLNARAFVDNTKAITLYEKVGFKEIKRDEKMAFLEIKKDDFLEKIQNN